MTTFDGSTTQTDGSGYAQAPPAAEVEPDLNVSMLDQLRDRVQEAREEKELWVHTIRRAGVRLTCDSDIDETEYKAWLKSSLPRKKAGRRRGPTMPDMTQLQQTTLSALAILNSCVKIEMLGSDGKTWSELTEKGQVLELDSEEMGRKFNIPDPIELVRTLFIRDADLINAGEELLTMAGYMPGDEDDDESDPT